MITRQRLQLDDGFVGGADAPISVKRVMDNVVVLDITFHKWGNTRQGDLKKVDTQADKKRLKLTKTLVALKEYDLVTNYVNSIRAWLTAVSLPSPLKRGTYLVPVASVARVSAYLDEVGEKYKAVVQGFVDVYPALVRAAEDELKDQFVAANYDTADKVASEFYIDRRFIDFGLPNVDKVGQSVWEAEKARAEKTWASAIDTIQDALRMGFRDLVDHLADKLEPKPDGTRKVFRDSNITNILEWIDAFKTRNVLGDNELASLVAQAERVLRGKKPDEVKKTIGAGGGIAGEMVRIKTALDKLLVDAPKRRISFDD